MPWLRPPYRPPDLARDNPVYRLLVMVAFAFDMNSSQLGSRKHSCMNDSGDLSPCDVSQDSISRLTAAHGPRRPRQSRPQPPRGRNSLFRRMLDTTPLDPDPYAFRLR
jgi:hypothetical protein